MTVFCMKSKELAVFRKNCLISGWKLLNFWPKSQATNWVAYQKNVYCCWCCRCCCYLLLLLVIGGALQFKIKWEHIQPQNSSSIRKISGKTTKEMRTFRGHFRLKKMFKSPAPRQIFTDSSKKGVYIGVCSTLLFLKNSFIRNMRHRFAKYWGYLRIEAQIWKFTRKSTFTLFIKNFGHPRHKKHFCRSRMFLNVNVKLCQDSLNCRSKCFWTVS